MARNEKKYKYSRLIKIRKYFAQSTLEYSMIVLMLILMIFGVFELGLMWHQYNSLEFATQDISSNLALLDNLGCGDAQTKDIIEKKTQILASGINLTYKPDGNGYVSEQSYAGTPFVTVKLDCSQKPPSLQIQSVHRLILISASLPNFKTGRRIVIIPDNVRFTSTKKVTLGKY